MLLRSLPLVLLVFAGCSSSDATTAGDAPDGSSPSATTAPTAATPPPASGDAGTGVAPGNPDGHCAVPPEAAAESIASPRTVIGTGTPESCTGDAFVAAVAKGGVITFDCGAAPATITLSATAKVHNDTGPVVIDGGGTITLSGGGKVRILYSNACDPDNGGYASSGAAGDCNEQEAPKLTVQNLAFTGGSVALGNVEAGGGGAIYVRGGRTKILSCTFSQDVCDQAGSDVGGGAIRVLDFPKAGSVARPVFVVGSTFRDNACANGGALSSIGTSWTILNSLFAGNHATGTGANEGNGGNGGAIYNDGNTMALTVCGASMTDNHANAGGSAIFFVSNDKSGTISIDQSTLTNNPKGDFETDPGLYVQAKTPATITNSTVK